MAMMDWTLAEWKDFGWAIGYILFSFVSYRVLQFAVRWYLFGKCSFRTFNYFEFVRRRRRPVPPSQSLQTVPPNKKWRICNESVSFFHSVISGLWALYACIIHPELAKDMLHYTDLFPKYLIYMSFGYLLHDLIDLLINERSARILELLFHHVVVIGAFLTTLVSDLFLGVVVFGLLMELNSVFLHTRSLMNLYGQPKTSTAFKFIALLNLATFLIFRMAVSVYLIYWQAVNTWTHLSWYYCLITFLIIYSLATTNTVLFYRVLAADGILGDKRARLNTNVPSSKSETEDDEESTDPYEEDVEAGPRAHNEATQTPKNGKIIRRESTSAATQTPNGTIQVSDTLPLTDEMDVTVVHNGTATNSTTISNA